MLRHARLATMGVLAIAIVGFQPPVPKAQQSDSATPPAPSTTTRPAPPKGPTSAFDVNFGAAITSDYNYRGFRVLVIDDDATVRSLMRRYLSREGFEVVTADGGREGLEFARDLHPSVITLDVFMPDMDGWSVLQAIKQDAELSRTPVNTNWGIINETHHLTDYWRAYRCIMRRRISLLSENAQRHYNSTAQSFAAEIVRVGPERNFFADSFLVGIRRIRDFR